MKTKIIISLLLGLITIAFLFEPSATVTNSGNTEVKLQSPPVSQNNISDSFLIAGMNDGYDSLFTHTDELGFNLWHYYGSAEPGPNGWYYPNGWHMSYYDPNDHLISPLDSYQTNVTAVFHDMDSHHMQAFMSRPKIEYLCYGQRSDYMSVDKSLVDDPDLWFYTFQSPGHVGQDVQDGLAGPTNQHYVRYCQANPTNPESVQGTVVSRLRTNNEQCHRMTGSWGGWEGDTYHDWYIKPRIRIDSTVAHNLSQNVLVCNIKVIAQDGSTILKNVDIHARDFLVDGDPPQYYNGRYIEEFNLPTSDTLIIHNRDWGDKWYYSSRGDYTDDGTDWNRADIQVYFYGNCDMWLDYVRVDNDIAHGLLDTNSSNHILYNQWIDSEATLASHAGDAPLKFYIELNEFNNIPAIAYVNHRLDSLTKMYGGRGIDMIADQLTFYQYHMNANDRGKITTPAQIKKEYIDKIGMKQVYYGAYPFTALETSSYSKIPNTLPKSTGDNNILAEAVSPSNYDTWLQIQLDTICDNYEQGGGGNDNYYDWPNTPCPKMPQIAGLFQWAWKLTNAISKEANIPIIADMQVHQWVYHCGEVEREPTNEELDMTHNLAVSYGAKGVVDEIYNGGDFYPEVQCKSWGFTETDGSTPRDSNFYGQPKWAKLKEIINRLKKWGPTLMSFDNTQTNSYIYRLLSERNGLLSTSYFADVITYKTGSFQPYCPNPPSGTSPQGLIYDCPDNRYLQVATFKKSIADGNKYFMIVNRRCSPYISESNEDSRGGERRVTLRFTNSKHDFDAAVNWNICDVLDPKKIVGQFTRNGGELVPLIDWFMPGEGRLYKITPVLKSGGTLIADEVIDGQSLTCEDTVWNNGYSITFKGNGNTISFTDSATIVMNGGTFQTDSASHGPQTNKNTFQGVSGNKWSGLHFNNANVKIYNSKFQDISSPVGGNYAINCINCPLNDIRYNTFISSTDTAGAVSIAYNMSSLLTDFDAYIMYNTFTMNNSYSRAVQIQNYAGITGGAYIENNSMSSNGRTTGIFVSTVTGGVIKNNTISGFATGVNMLLSGCDLYGNIITNTAGEGKGITAADLSYVNMAPTSSGEWTGGMNSLTNAGEGSINLEIDNSAFCMLNGYNIFDIDTSKAQSPFHLHGSFWLGDFTNSLNDGANCFKMSGNVLALPDLPNVYVTDYNDNQAGLNFPQYTCDGTPPTNYDIADIGNGLYDTIPNMNGQGGGYSSISSPKTIYDSIRVQLRHRNYSVVKNLCYELINAYPDSGASITSLQTLYMASIASDTTQTSYINLKSYYENLILNHGSNGAMVKISNYLVQKCKVLLRQYSSALAGFQQIINNNQYNYEGLLARWDYMATSLLMNGQGGGESISPACLSFGAGRDFGIEIADLNTEPEFDEPDGDKSPFTKEQKVAIRKSVINTLEGSKRTDEQKINILKERQKNGDVTANIELRQKSALKNIIKTERPKNIFEHLKIVNGDIQKIFGNHEPLKKDPKNQLPMVYNLYQNFPNPFNPSTKINFDLPKDSKVTLIIYDILGRVVKRLINSEFKQAGRYSIDFNGINYASGVYFYRIEAGDYVMSKKMVLVK